MARYRNFRTGEFADLVGVNKRTLHYYDERGIFRPAHTEANGYRSYGFRQLWSFFMIRLFRAMGLELAEIEDYMTGRTPESLLHLLGEQEKWLDAEIARLKRQKRIVANQQRILRAAPALKCDAPHIEELPECRMIVSENVRALTLQGDFAAAETIAAQHVRYTLREQTVAGLSFGAMVAPDEFMTAGRESAISYYFTVTEEPWRTVARHLRHTRQAGRFAVIYFSGDYYETAAPYARLRDYMAAQGLEPAGYSYEESIIDDMSAMEEKDYITRIAIPIKKKV